MNKKLFETYFSDLVLYTLKEQPTDEKQTVNTSRPTGVNRYLPQQGGVVPNIDPMIPPEPIEVEGDDMVNVAPSDPLTDPTQLIQIKVSLGRIYELKKIYSKLLSISKLLNIRSNVKYSELETEVDEALDMFHIISLNLDKFQPKIDTIIVEFYRFIKKALEELEKLSNQKTDA